MKRKGLAALIWVALLAARWQEWRGEQAAIRDLCANFSSTNRWVSFEGSAVRSEEGDLIIEAPRLAGGRVLPTRLRVTAPFSDPVRGGEFGQELRISGPVRCQALFRNPGRAEDGTWAFFRPELRLSGNKAHWEILDRPRRLPVRITAWWQRELIAALESFPGLTGLVRAVWMGSEQGLPERWLPLYRDLGLLPILALSGQHVVILAMLWGMGIRGLARGLAACSLPHLVGLLVRLPRGLPLAGALLLYFTSGGVPSIRRTLAMVAAMTLLRGRGIYSPPLSLCLSTCALLLLWDPHLLLSPGFLLSALFTALTLGVVGASDRRGLFRPLLAMVVAPAVLGIPITAFFFSRVAWIAVLSQLLLAPLWELVWIPIGFLLPLIARFLPGAWREPILTGLEFLWERFGALQLEYLSPLASTCTVVVRPTWGELLVLEIGLLWLMTRWLGQKKG